MTDATISPLQTSAEAPDDRVARRNVAILVAAQAILGAQLPIMFILGGLSGQILAENKALATVPISVTVLSTMFAAPAISALMGRYGRRPGFLLGALGGAVGAGLGAWALLIGSFPLLVSGAAFTGVYMAAQGFYRFAAADAASPAFRPKAISWVMAGGLLSAVLGPELVKLTRDMLAPAPFAGAYVAAAGLNIVGFWLFLLLREPRPTIRASDGPRGRPLSEIVRH
ncbi:MAG: MFS transporter, partial [Rubrimonas sp.]